MEIVYIIGAVILISMVAASPLFFIHKSIMKTKKEVEDRNACLHIVYSIPYRQKNGKEIIIFMNVDGNKKNGRTIGIRCRPDSFCKIEEYDERDMKFYAQLISEGYFIVDDNYMYCKDWSNYVKSGTIYEGTWKEYVRSRKRN